MNYKSLFPSTTPIKVGLIGTGAFGNSFLYQLRAIPRLQPTAVCDINIDAARQACLHAGWLDEALALCSTQAQAQDAVAAGRIALVEDAQLLMPLPIDAIVEATGIPEAGAAHAQAALDHGKHVIMVTKEVDCVVGPILSKMATERGLVYSQADGDQPSMLIGLISWAQTLGLEVICAGKSSESDFVYDEGAGTIRNRSTTVDVSADQLSDDGLWSLWEMPAGKAQEVVQRRRDALHTIPQHAVPDLCEMAVVMNATGYGYDAPTLHAPIVRITELADVWAAHEDGGILSAERGIGVIDGVNCLRRSDEVGFAGGVFVVFACHDKATWRLLRDKGHIVSRDLSRAAVFMPYHLLGVETATSLLSAVDLKLPTGALSPQPTIDLCVLATESLKAGQRLVMSPDHVIPGTRPQLMPATPLAPGNPVPYYMAAQNSLTRDVPAGTVITVDMIDPDPTSALWTLRRRQDQEMAQR